MNKHRVVILLLINLVIFSTGCWDMKDIQNLSIVRVMTADLITVDGTDKWLVTQLVMNPAGKGNTGDETKGTKPANPEIPFMGTGVTMEDAIAELAKRTPRFPFFAHLSTIIIGERAAKEKIMDITELTLRYREARPTYKVMVTKGEAYKLTESEPEGARTISEEIDEYAERTVEPLGLSIGRTAAQFTSQLLSVDRDAIDSEIYINYPSEKRGEKRAGPAKSIIVEGLAVFSNQKLAGWFDKDQTVGYILATKKVHSGEMRIDMERNGKTFSYILRKSKPKVKTQLNENKLSVTLNLSIDGSIYEAHGMNLSAEDIKEVEEIASERIKGLIENTIAQAKEYKSDCFGFTQNLHRWHVSDWKKIKQNWREAFVAGDVVISVDAKISDTGRIGEHF